MYLWKMPADRGGNNYPKKYLEYIRLDEIQKQIKWIKFALTIAERSHFKIVDNFNESEKNE